MISNLDFTCLFWRGSVAFRFFPWENACVVSFIRGLQVPDPQILIHLWRICKSPSNPVIDLGVAPNCSLLWFGIFKKPNIKIIKTNISPTWHIRLVRGIYIYNLYNNILDTPFGTFESMSFRTSRLVGYVSL